MSKNRILKMAVICLAFFLTGIVFMLGVTAITNAKKVEFNLGTKYNPEVYVGVEMQIDGEYKQIFSSADPTEVNYTAYYIESIANSTINLKNETLFIENGAVNLKFYNYDTRYKINCYINNTGAPITLAKPTSASEPTILEHSVSVGENQLGVVLISLRFEALEEVEISYSTYGATKTTAPGVILPGESATIILQAEHEDYTKWTITVNGEPVIPTIDWTQAKTKATFTVNNITSDTQISATAEIDYWEGDGDIETFPAGDGTSEATAYEIRNGAQLAYLAKITNEGTATSGEYYKLTKNIYLNDETFENLQNGYVKIYDENNITYVGDGSGRVNNNSYSTLSTAGTFYSYANSSYTALSTQPTATNNKLNYGTNGVLNIWTAIGNPSAKFLSYFEGSGKTVSGVYINNTTFNQGLFGVQGYVGWISNTNIIDGYIRGGGYVGGILGCFNDYGVGISNSSNSATICGDNSVGGICGSLGTSMSSSVIGCSNNGVVSGIDYVGGIMGRAKYMDMRDCVNNGTISGTKYIGGLAGEATWGDDSYNNGKIYGNNYVGGLFGYLYAFRTEADVIENITCSTSATYYGVSNVGELYGGYYYECFIAGTQVLTYNGYKNIEDIQTGDKVLTINEETKEFEWKEVLFPTKKWTSIKITTIVVNGEELTATSGHKFYVKNNSEYLWKEIGELSIGDYIVSYDNGAEILNQITATTSEMFEGYVYNMEVSENHNYMVSNNNLIAHNGYS